jgi:ABC transporter family protein
MITKPRTIKKLPYITRPVARTGRNTERAEVRIVLFVLASFLLGAAAGAFWAYRPQAAAATDTQNQNASQPGGLSESTRAVLSRLSSPVEIRFYAVLDPANSSESVRAFASRIDQLLAAFAREANGKISVTHSNSQAYANVKAASADGLKPFNEDKGEPDFLGMVVINKDQRTALPQLSPDWEPALEADIARAILSTIPTVASASTTVATASKLDLSSVEEIKRSIPNLDSVSLAEATRTLREASFKDFALAASQFQTQLKEAQQRLKEAQNGGSETEQQAAIKNLQQVQDEQTARLKQIAAKAQAQVELLKQLKSGTP